MRHVSPLVKAAVFLAVGCAAALSDDAPARAQSPAPQEQERPQAPERPRLKNFDPRLRPKADEKANAEAQQKGDDGDDVIRVETTLVVSDVLVLDKQGRSVAGLRREDFVVKEDGAPQEIGTFSLGSAATVPRSIVLVIDHSGSQFPYLKTSIEAAKTLVDKLGPRDRMAIVTDNVELLTDFTQDRALLKEKLDSLWQRITNGQGGGRSEHYSALLAALTELFDEEDLRPVVILQADGDELMALKGSGERSRYLRERAFSFEDLLTAAERSRATVYTIIPGVRFIGLSEEEQVRQAKADVENRSNATGGMYNPAAGAERRGWADRYYKRWAASMHRRQLAMAGLAKYTGGWADYLERPEDARAVYARVFAGLNSRYVIGYYPTNRARDGKRRKVSVEVRGHPEYVVWGRKTYFAPGP